MAEGQTWEGQGFNRGTEPTMAECDVDTPADTDAAGGSLLGLWAFLGNKSNREASGLQGSTATSAYPQEGL